MDRSGRAELAVLCLIKDGDKVLLQNRVKKDWPGYTLPGGHVECGESFVDAVIREMKEETGLTAGKWTFLGAIETSPGFLTEQLYLYMARDLTPGAQHLDEGEFLETVRMPLAEAAARAADGRIDDGKTVAAVLRAAYRLEKEN